MAYATGIATNYIDLLSRLETFLTSDTALVSAGQAWTTLRYSNGVAPTTFTGRIAFGTPTTSVTCLDARPGVLPATNYLARIFGTINIPTTGTYTFGIDGDNCLDLLIDGNFVVGWYGSHAVADNYSHSQAVPLTAGNHTFEVRFVQGNDSNLGVSVGWQKPGDGSIAIIPAGNLSSMQIQWSSYAGSIPSNTSGMDSLLAGKELIIKAPGLSGTEEVFVGIRPISNVPSDYYNWGIMSSVGYNAAGDWAAQPYNSGIMYVYLCNDPMKYWFVANGNRVVMVVKVNTVYQIMYLGKFLPYFLPNQYPYPVIVGGTHSAYNSRWSDANYDYSCIASPGEGCRMYYIDGTWKQIRNRFDSSGTFSWDDTKVNIWPTSSTSCDVRVNSTAWPDGGYSLLPFVLEMASPVNTLGEIDGMFWISGHQNASENLVNIGGQDYLVVQNVSRTSRGEYMAVRLA